MMWLEAQPGLSAILAGADDAAWTFASEARRATNLTPVPALPAGQNELADPATALSRHS